MYKPRTKSTRDAMEMVGTGRPQELAPSMRWCATFDSCETLDRIRKLKALGRWERGRNQSLGMIVVERVAGANQLYLAALSRT